MRRAVGAAAFDRAAADGWREELNGYYIVFNIPAGGLENKHLTALEYRYIASQPALMRRTVFVTGATF